jgi:hypothetical protein
MAARAGRPAGRKGAGLRGGGPSLGRQGRGKGGRLYPEA